MEKDITMTLTKTSEENEVKTYFEKILELKKSGEEFAVMETGIKELIPISEHNGKKAVSARLLYNFLNASERFSSWSMRMFKYGFIEGRDYVGCKEFNTLANQEFEEYALSISAAKELSMVEGKMECLTLNVNQA
jgi:phage anti-repressor protein